MNTDKMFLIEGIKENVELEKNMNFIVNRIKEKFFDNDLPEFLKMFHCEMNRYSRWIYIKLIREVLNKDFITANFSAQTAHNYYKNIDFMVGKGLETLGIYSVRSELLKGKILDLDFNVINNIRKYYTENKSSEDDPLLLFESIFNDYLHKTYDSKNFEAINAIMGKLEPHEYMGLFLNIFDGEYNPVFIGQQPDMPKGTELINRTYPFWDLCLHLNYVFFSAKSLDNFHALFTDIDSFREEVKSHSDTKFYKDFLDKMFCDNVKACLLTKYTEFEDKPDHILKMIENDYDKAFENLNGISFKQYLLNQGYTYTEWHNRNERDKEIIEYLDIKDNQEIGMGM